MFISFKEVMPSLTSYTFTSQYIQLYNKPKEFLLILLFIVQLSYLLLLRLFVSRVTQMAQNKSCYKKPISSL